MVAKMKASKWHQVDKPCTKCGSFYEIQVDGKWYCNICYKKNDVERIVELKKEEE